MTMRWQQHTEALLGDDALTSLYVGEATRDSPSQQESIQKPRYRGLYSEGEEGKETPGGEGDRREDLHA